LPLLLPEKSRTTSLLLAKSDGNRIRIAKIRERINMLDFLDKVSCLRHKVGAYCYTPAFYNVKGEKFIVNRRFLKNL